MGPGGSLRQPCVNAVCGLETGPEGSVARAPSLEFLRQRPTHRTCSRCHGPGGALKGGPLRRPDHRWYPRRPRDAEPNTGAFSPKLFDGAGLIFEPYPAGMTFLPGA